MNSQKNSASSSCLVIQSLNILGHAERDIKGIFKVAPAAAALIVADIRKLPINPRPLGYSVVVGQKGVFRIHTANKYRLIYTILDPIQSVVAVRLEGKSTYKNIPVHDLTSKIKEIEENLENASCRDFDRLP
ncbi:MAG: type II toxin-antitoxin system RelE/ParE family toxin [Deltaproteobacteria bacterium]|nr:type II toxin-antitoxin system RelE/ParE family toxin [Deltaproteobacteria bacterium]